MKRGVIAIIVGILVLSLPSFSQEAMAAGQRSSAQAVVNAFSEFAFLEGGDSNNERRLWKRYSPIKYQLIGDFRADQLGIILRFLDDISKLTGLEISLGDIGKWNFIFIISNNPEREAKEKYYRFLKEYYRISNNTKIDHEFIESLGLNKKFCPRSQNNNDEEILSGYGFFNPQVFPGAGDLWVLCFALQTLNSVGLINVNASNFEKLLILESDRLTLTELGSDLVRVLYDDSIKFGLTENEAIKLVSEITIK